MSMRDHIIRWAREREPVSINEIAEHVQILFEKQAAAAKQGMDAAKAHGSHMEAEAKRLHAECNPEALESERQANAELTEELEALRSERDATLEQVVYWRECVQDMVAKAAANNLDGYRELGQRVVKAEAERDGLGRLVHDKAVLLQRAEGERDALAAHVERMREVWQRLHLRSPVHVEVLKAYSHVMRDTPTTSLGRLKAQWQAEALDKALKKLVPRMLTKADAQIVRDTIRAIKTPGSRQAEEPTE